MSATEYSIQLQTWVNPLLEKIQLGQRQISLRGVWGASRGLLLAGLQTLQERPILVITASSSEAHLLFHDLQFFHKLLVANQANKPAYYFPAWEILPYEPLSPQPDISANRLNILYQLLSEHKKPILVTSLPCVMQRIISKKALGKAAELLMTGEEVSRERIIKLLCEGGYKAVDMVEGREEYSVRGGIIDFFGPGLELPVRIEFFGDEISSLRSFDYETQRSVKELEEVILLPISEAILNPQTIERLVKNVKRQGAESPLLLEELLARLELGHHFSGIEQYIPFLYEETNLLLDYLPPDTLIVLDEPDYVEKQGVDFEHKVAQEFLQIGNTPYPAPKDSYLEWEQCKRALNKQVQLHLASLPFSERKTAMGAMKYEVRSLDLVKAHVPGEKGYLGQVAEHLRRYLDKGEQVVIACASEGQAQRMQEILLDYDLVAGLVHDLRWSPGDFPSPLGGEGRVRGTVFSEDVIASGAKQSQPKSEIASAKSLPRNDSSNKGLIVTVGDLSAGFRLPALSLVILSESDIFGEQKKAHPRSPYRSSRFLSTFSDMQVGDYVVHVDSGIGRYLGLTKLTIDNRIVDFLLLEYQDNDKLYVPLDRLYLVQKYMGGDEEKVELHKLGSKKWVRQKENVKAALLEMAQELVKLYAAREVLEGYSFASDTHWQKEFEASFDYTETPDQLKAIEDIKHDMEQAKPMDRLVCGDVGYGKTEVALRAAFKAVENGKQVAVLVPTTILAQQHFNTFSKRMAAYPFKVDMLSRFKTVRERTQTLADLKSGAVDVVIGTHSLLQKGVEFADLGLLIIDEEQHFGVKHKEKIKALRQQVDVLTLTATPIPRTLQMAFSGLRDLSIIATPPEGRLDIHNEIVPFDKTIIREAILREMERGGQAFFIHNRVENIEQIADIVRSIVPEARITVAHGKMPEKMLEDIIYNFLNGKYDVLVCTTIIESGVDIANANTIIINRADTFGLAQLYQLRGRVGRSDQRAYAYLLIPPGQVLSKNAQKRLEAIEELSELGAGFRLAAYDLEIRGAGNILGPQQHGEIASVGFGLYCELMEEAVKEIKGLPVEEKVEPVLELKINARLSEEYIPDTNQRLTFYKRLSTVESAEQLEQLLKEMQDRYGRLPEEAETLLKVMRLKLSARQLGITKVMREKGGYILGFGEQTKLSPKGLVGLIQRNSKRMSLTPENQLLVRQAVADEKDVCAEVEKIFAQLQEVIDKGNH